MKCLDGAHDKDSSEAETKVALEMASKLMRQNNINETEVLAHGQPEERKKHGDQSIVILKRRDGDVEKTVCETSYLNVLGDAMKIFFDCKSYTESTCSGFETRFYGIAENTVAAASAYCVVHNRMVEWARPYKSTADNDCYCHGVCKELCRTAKQRKEFEKMDAIFAETDARGQIKATKSMAEESRLSAHPFVVHVLDGESQIERSEDTEADVI